MNDRTKGLLIMMTGILAVSPDAVLTRYLRVGGSGSWTIVFWKMLFAAPVAAPFAVWEAGGIVRLWESAKAAGWYYLAIVPLQALIEIGFILSFVHTSAAKALLLINLNPLWCALAGRMVLGERLPVRTIAALAVALGCVLLIFVPELIGSTPGGDDDDDDDDDEQQQQQQQLLGNGVAFATGLGLAGYITLVRHAGTKHPEPLSLIGSTVGGVLLALLVSLVVTKGAVHPRSYWEDWDGDIDIDIDIDSNKNVRLEFWAASVGHGTAVGILFVAITIAPRLITGAEVGLGLLLEVVLGPLWVGLVYGDVPSLWTIAGGSGLLLVLVVHEVVPLLLLPAGGAATPTATATATTTTPSEPLDVDVVRADADADADADASTGNCDGDKNGDKDDDEEEAIPSEHKHPTTTHDPQQEQEQEQEQAAEC